MYEQKTKETDNDVIEFIENVENQKKRANAYTLLDIFKEATGFEAKNVGSKYYWFWIV